LGKLSLVPGSLLPASCTDRTSGTKHSFWTVPLVLRLYNPTALHARVDADSKIYLRSARALAEGGDGLVGVGSLALPKGEDHITAAPRSQAKVALVVDLRGVVSTSLGVAAGNPLHSLEGDTLFIDTAVRLVALGMRIRIDFPRVYNFTVGVDPGAACREGGATAC